MTNGVPLEQGKFYARRDDRTDQLVESHHYQTAPICVKLDSEISNTITGQVMLITASNLLSRFNQDVDIITPDCSLTGPLQRTDNQPSLQTRIEQELEEADPFGEFKVTETMPSEDYEWILALGDVSVPEGNVVRATSCGWGTRITRNQPIQAFNFDSSNLDNPIGPAAAACFGVAEIFKSLIGVPDRQRPDAYEYDTYTLTANPDNDLHTTNPPLPDTITLGTVELAGVGSIGSSLLYVIDMLPVSAEFVLTDHDIVEYENLNRSPVFSVEDAVKGHAKVTTGARYLAGHDGITVQTHTERYGETKDQDAVSPDIVIPEVDDNRAREDIQYSRPPLMVGGTTNGSAVNVRRQLPIKEACLLCHFPPQETSYSPACAVADVETRSEIDDSENDSGDAALPFVSVLAGVLVAGELVKTQFNAFPIVESFVEVETFSSFSVDMPAYPKEREPDCSFCEYTNFDWYREYIDDTKFVKFWKSKME